MSQTTLKPKAKPAASKKRAKPDTEDEDSDPDEPQLNNNSVLSTTPPSSKKQKTAPKTKKTAAKPLQELENEAMGFDGADDPKPQKGSKSTETYQKASYESHAILFGITDGVCSSPNSSTSLNGLTPTSDRLSEVKSRCGFIILSWTPWK